MTTEPVNNQTYTFLISDTPFHDTLYRNNSYITAKVPEYL